MKKIIILLIILLPLKSICQQTISGKVFDALTNKPLVSATILATGTTNGATSLKDGTFFLDIDDDVKEMVVSYGGYKTRTILLSTFSNSSVIAMELSFEQNLVTVTGSRNITRTAVKGTVPVDILPIAAMAQQMGQVNLGQLLNYSVASFQSAKQTNADGSDHIDPISLRGMAGDQILVLVNGKRRHQSAFINSNGTANRGQGVTDLDAIPVAAIEKVEILRDGAAAQYGTEAIAGLINIILKKDTSVLSGSIYKGEYITGYQKNYALDKLTNSSASRQPVQDGVLVKAGLNYGVNLNNNGFINFTAAYEASSITNRTGLYTGQIFPLSSGTNKDDSILSARKLTRNAFDMRIGNSKNSSGAILVNASFVLDKNWSLNVVTDFSQKSGQSAGFYRYPGEVSNVAATYSSQALSIYPNGFLPKINTVIQDYSLSAGLTGKLGKWNTSLSNTLGINVFDVKVDNSIDYTEQAFVVHPQQQFYAGGTHNLQNTINLDLSRNFNVLSGLNIAYGAETRLDQYKQEKGNIASFQNYDTTSGSIGGVQSFPGFTPNYSHLHNRSSSAVYLDVEQDFSKNILVDFALRYQKYSDFGEALTYKIGSKYKITDRFEVNGSTSTAFRPPSLQQQFYSKTSSLFLPCFGGGIPTEVATLTNDSRAAQILGIPPLIGEMANSFSLGFMASPSNWLDISVNGYLTAIKNRIVLTSNFNGTNNTELAQILSNNAATQVNFFSNAIDTRSKGIEAVLNYHTIFGNLNRLRFSLSAAYNQNEVVKAADGKPLLKTSPTLISSMQLNNYFNREEQSRIEVASPKLKGNFAAYFTHKTLVIMVRINYFGQVRYISPIINPQAPSTFPYNTFTGLQQTTDQTFKAKTVTDLSLSFNINKSFTLNFGVNNVFDTYPDKQLHSENVAMGRFIYNPHVQQMGSNGRYVFGRIAFNIKNI